MFVLFKFRFYGSWCLVVFFTVPGLRFRGLGLRGLGFLVVLQGFGSGVEGVHKNKSRAFFLCYIKRMVNQAGGLLLPVPNTA